MGIFSQDYKEHYKQNLILATPVIFGQIGHMLASVADNIMVGRVSSVQLAASSFGNAIIFLIFIIGIGISIGLTPLVGRAIGAKDSKKAVDLFKSSIIINLITGIAITIILLILIQFFDFMGQEPEVARYAKLYVFPFALSMIPYSIFISFKQFSDGLGRTKPGMVLMLSFNLLNIVLNYFLVYGNYGAPRLEIAGAAWATFISRVLMMLGAFYYFYFIDDFKIFRELFSKAQILKKDVQDLLKMGIPIAAQYFLEVAAFAGGSIIVGMVSSMQQAAHQIALSLASFTFMIATGLASASTIRISHAIGEENFVKMRRAGVTSLLMVVVFMSLTALLFIFKGDLLANLYVDSKEVQVIQFSIGLLIIGGFFQLFDGVQAVALGTLRGMEDVRIPTIITVISYWVITIPLSYYVGKILGYGAYGVWYCYLIGLTIASVLLYLRFDFVSKKIIKTGKVAIN
jgi:MATE family multidrug resistance protein